MSTILFPLFAALLAGAPASGPNEPKQAVQQPAKEKKICQREVHTGSIMPKVVCRTQKQLDEMTARAQQSSQRMQERAQSLATGQ